MVIKEVTGIFNPLTFLCHNSGNLANYVLLCTVRTQSTLERWSYISDPSCDWEVQSMGYILNQRALGPRCSDFDLREITKTCLAAKTILIIVLILSLSLTVGAIAVLILMLII